MRDRFPVLIAAIAVGVVVVLGVWIRLAVVPSPDAHDGVAANVTPSTGRSARVEERLQALRDSYARRQQLAASQPGDMGSVGAGASPNGAKTPGEIGHDVDRRKHWQGRNPASAAQAKPTRPAHKSADPEFLFFHQYPKSWDEKPDVDTLEETLLHGTTPAARREALDQLLLEDDDDALRALTTVMLAPELGPEMLTAVLEALSDYTEGLSAEMIVPVLQDPNPRVRFEALALLGDMGSTEARAAVRTALNDPDPEVRDLARGILDIGS
jgi:hypothetical protein